MEQQEPHSVKVTVQIKTKNCQLHGHYLSNENYLVASTRALFYKFHTRIQNGHLFHNLFYKRMGTQPLSSLGSATEISLTSFIGSNYTNYFQT